ncbi:hypothetical protein COCOBI_07-2760 [Coccomyxa sp. Obi]|nr:hypothetical protein COCOBI_07-2760 [Coccomyxa sp. Obi]
MCNKTLERMARAVLQGLCRSCHMRLHTSTFLGLLEDLPLRENVQSCSTLQAVKYVRASNEAGPSSGPPLAWPLVQEGMTPPGLVMVMKSQPAHDPDRECPVSKLQVKDRTGTWIDVPLKQDEVAVFLGKTAEVASSGLLKASTYRLVGELQKGSGHQNLEYHLCARPDANLDLFKQLEAAGHHLPERRADSDGMNDLVRQFSAVLTPPNQTPPNRIPGRGRASMGSLEMHTIPSTELQNKSRKRVSGEVRRAPSPVTRSGKVARTSAGLVNREHRLRGRGGDASDEAEPFMEEDCAPQGDTEAEEVLCVTVDGQGVNTDRLLTLRMVYETTRTEVALRTHRRTSLARLFEVFCNTVGANLSTVKFMHNGERLSGNHTCRQLCDIDQPIIVSDVDC